MNDVPASAPDSHLEALTGHRVLSIALSRTGHRSALVMLAVVVLIAVASVEIVSTYHVFSGTSDEPATEAAGMEWLDRGTYRLDDTHPPLARIAVALGPYLEGLRLPADSNDWSTVGNQIFCARGQYSRNLALARFGNPALLHFRDRRGLELGSRSSRRIRRAMRRLAVLHPSSCAWKRRLGNNGHRAYSDVHRRVAGADALAPAPYLCSRLPVGVRRCAISSFKV